NLTNSTHHHQNLHPFPTRRSSDLSLVRQHLMKRESSGKKEKDPHLEWKITLPVQQFGNLDDFILAESVKESQYYFLSENRSDDRSEEHTSELQSHLNLVCRLLLEK